MLLCHGLFVRAKPCHNAAPVPRSGIVCARHAAAEAEVSAEEIPSHGGIDGHSIKHDGFR